MAKFLNVNIHENITVSSSSCINPKHNSLDLVFASKASDDIFAAMGGDEDIAPATTTVKLFYCSKSGYQGKVKSWTEVAEDLQSQAAVLREILKVYMDTNTAKARLGQTQMFLGLGVTNANAKNMLPTALQDDTFIAKISKNIFTAFLDAIKPHLDSKATFRIKFVRQSATVSYPTLTKKVRASEPFIESSVIPLDQSKVAYTEYELDKKLNSNADAKVDKIDEAVAAPIANMFGAPAAPAVEAQTAAPTAAPVMEFAQAAPATAQPVAQPVAAQPEFAAVAPQTPAPAQATAPAEEAPIVSFGAPVVG